MRYLFKADKKVAVSTARVATPAIGRKITSGGRGGTVVGVRPNGTPIYASERNRNRKQDINEEPKANLDQAKLKEAEKRINALEAKGKDVSSLKERLNRLKSAK